MNAANWITLAGMVIANLLIIGPRVKAWLKGRERDAKERGLVPLKYFEQIQAGQADYIQTLEKRLEHSLDLWRACEEDKNTLRTRIATLEARLNEIQPPP